MGKRFWLDLFACFLIPAYTLLFAGSAQWFSTNFSVLAVLGADRYRGFLWWGILAGGYFFVVLNALACRLPGRRARAGVRLLSLAAVLSLAYALAIPYLPRQFPTYAGLHIVLAASSCALLMADLLTVILVLRRQDRTRWNGCLWVWCGVVAACGVIFLIPRMVSTALEVFFTISAALLARRIMRLAEF